MFFLFAFALSSVEDEIIEELKSLRSSVNELRGLLASRYSKPIFTRPVRPQYPPSFTRNDYNNQAIFNDAVFLTPTLRSKRFVFIPTVFESESESEGAEENHDSEEFDFQLSTVQNNKGSSGHPDPSKAPLPLANTFSKQKFQNSEISENEQEEPLSNVFGFSAGGHFAPSKSRMLVSTKTPKQRVKI